MPRLIPILPRLNMAARTEQKATSSKAPSYSMLATLFGIRKSFTNVKQLQTEDLQSWINNGNSPIILDIRDEDEYKVSHLPGAICTNPQEPIDQVTAKIFEKCKELQHDGCVNVVSYCSLGYRSSSMTQKIDNEMQRLKEAGSDVPPLQAYNLEGSIFKWANEGRKMVDCASQETRHCHPYNFAFGKLLDYNLRKYPDTMKTENT